MKKVDDVFLRAAKKVNDYRGNRWGRKNGYPSCLAVRDSGGRFDMTKDDYADLFVPDNGTCIYEPWGLGWATNREGRTNCRVLALLFAQAMRKAGDL